MTWSVIVCSPQCERKLGDAINEAGLEAFVPTYTAWRPKFGRYGAITRPLIQGYVFAIMAPHQVHDFRQAGAVRILPMHPIHSFRVARMLEQWNDLGEIGVFDDEKPPEPKPPKVRTARNRKARRKSGEAKRQVFELKEGLEQILREMNEPQAVAA